MNTSPSYVEVILPVPLAPTFTYHVPEEMRERLNIGMRVIVPFGKHKFYTGIVVSYSMQMPQGYEVKDVAHLLDDAPVVRHPQMKLWEWVSEYYLCNLGDVYKAAMPSGMKIESETNFESNPDYEAADIALLSEREAMVMRLLQQKGKMSVKDLEKETGFRTLPSMMQRMVDKGAAIVSESLVNRYRPKKENYVSVAIPKGDKEALAEAFAKVKGAPKQEKLLMTLLQMSGYMQPGAGVSEVRLPDLLDRSGVTSTIMKALVDKGIAQRYTKEISRFRYDGSPVSAPATLTPWQDEALREIHKSFKDKGVTLLHGVTSSGKTEVYTHLIDYVLRQGNQVLLLVPEIALTTQLTGRLQKVFGDSLIVYHSKFTDNERVEIWYRMLRSPRPCVVVGARSSVFLPFGKLGLVIVDEEHDVSYKQYDPAPRYSARDTAIMLAHMHGGKTLLGSATPSVETYYKALSGKYGLVRMGERYQGVALPQMQVVDMAAESRKRQVKGSFASATIAAVRGAVSQGQQAILFHSRRGYAPMAHCTQCQYIPKCQHCDVSLTYHKRANVLVCHYCGATYPLPETCPVCKEPSVEVVGYGTERIEDEVCEAFGDARILRMDLDTTRNKSSYSKLIDDFSSHKADILVGTQMVTKGLDFGNVSVAVAVNADSVINYPDFRSAERAFNMLEQVAGRAGRRDTQGTVIIQTRTPDHPVIGYVRNHDYEGFYRHEIEERRMYAYPPFTKVIYIYIKHRDDRELDTLSMLYATKLRELFGTRVNGPVKPGVARIQNLYIRRIMLKVELNASMAKVKEILRRLYVQMHTLLPGMRRAILYYDVDPV